MYKSFDARMEAIIDARYVSFDFSNILGFPNLVPDKEEWGHCLPRFRGEYWEVLVEHLLDFHECMHQLGIIHEDVLINMFRYSMEGNAKNGVNIYLDPTFLR
jgi:hypothetical protein